MVTSVKRSHRLLGENTVELVNENLRNTGPVLVTDIDAVTVRINHNGNALDQFSIEGRIADGTSFQVLFDEAADFTSPAGILIGASGDLTSLASGATGWFLLYPKGFKFIRIQVARASGANTTINIVASGS